MKKLLVLMLAGVIAVGISFGCGKKEPAPTKTGETTAPAEKTTPPVETPPK
jgi:hypothetical protein